MKSKSNDSLRNALYAQLSPKQSKKKILPSGIDEQAQNLAEHQQTFGLKKGS